MNIELKKVKIHPDMSQETNCFSADIWLDGKRAGSVQNSGTGGNNTYWWEDRDAGQRLNAWADQQPLEFKFDRLDQVIGRLLDEYETRRFLTRATKTKTVYRLKGDKPGSWWEIKMPYSDKVKQHLVAKHGDKIEIIANDDIEAAVKKCA